MSESDLLAHIQRIAGTGQGADVLVGPGDDCAVVRTPGGDALLLTVDQVVEGRHFEEGTSIDLIARKAVARSISDIASMGGAPRWGLATGLLPDGYAHGRELVDAIQRWGLHWACPIVGGDIAFGPGPLALTITVVGTLPPHAQRSGQAGGRDVAPAPILRSGAEPGDELWLTGQVGGSFESGWHLRFEPRVEAGQAALASGRVHAMVDLSDGLGRDASRMGVASNVRLVIEASKLPISHRARDWAQAAGDGEDYELLMAIRPRHPEVTEPPLELDPPMLGPIGVVRACQEGESPGATIIDPYANAHDAAALGWDHGESGGDGRDG